MTQEHNKATVLEGLLAVLSRGATTGTNKLSLLLALIELAPALASDHISNRLIAKELLQLAWDQTAPFDGAPIRQVTSGNRRNTTAVLEAQRLQHLATQMQPRNSGPHPASFDSALNLIPDSELEMSLKFVIRDARRNPIAKLQNIDGGQLTFLYEVEDGGVCLRPGARETLVMYGPLLREIVESRYVQAVITCNPNLRASSVDEKLREHLFGGARQMPPKVLRDKMLDVQGGKCIYTGDTVSAGERSVDHVVPWARVRISSLDNLVITSASMNSKKRDFLLGPESLGRLLGFFTSGGQEARSLCDRFSWPWNPTHTYATLSRLYAMADPQMIIWEASGVRELGAQGSKDCAQAASDIADVLDAQQLAH